MKREQVFQIINTERDYQDKTYNPAKVCASGLTRLERDKEVTPHLVLLDEYITKAKTSWTTGKGTNVPSLQQIAKIAAIAVRALERAGGSEALLSEGLR